MTFKKQENDVFMKVRELNNHSIKLEYKIQSIKTLTHLQLEYNILLSKYNNLVKVVKSLSVDKTSNNNFKDVLNNLDLRQYKILKCKFDQLKDFFELKYKCLNLLPKVYNNSLVINEISSAESNETLMKVLNKVPLEILITNGLVKVDSKESWITKKSVKAISTNMKNQ